MDPFSQAALGAVVAQAAGHRQLGFKAALIGAGAGALPDIDVFFSIGGDFVDQLVTHRGITHALIFAPVVGPLLGWAVFRLEARGDPNNSRYDNRRRHAWMLVTTLALLSHPLLDLLTPYGTQLLLPFSDARFAINAMPIIDPIFTLALFLGLLAAWLSRNRSDQAVQRMALVTLVISSGYLGFGWLQNLRAEAAASEQLAAAGIEVERLAAFPTVLQVHLRRVVARSSDIDRVGYYSTWAPCEITWYPAPRLARASYDALLKTREGRVFDWFSMGWAHYAIVRSAGERELVASDLRYGFDEDPTRSVFTISTWLNEADQLRGTPTAGRQVPVNPDRALDQLLANAYSPACYASVGGVSPHTAPHDWLSQLHRSQDPGGQ